MTHNTIAAMAIPKPTTLTPTALAAPPVFAGPATPLPVVADGPIEAVPVTFPAFFSLQHSPRTFDTLRYTSISLASTRLIESHLLGHSFLTDESSAPFTDHQDATELA